MSRVTASNAISKAQSTPSPALRERGCFEAGFTLIEIMLALAVFSFMALGMAYGMSMTIRNSGDSQVRQDIVMRVQNHLNSQDWNNICPSAAPGAPAVAANVVLSNGTVQAINIICANTVLGGQNIQTVAATATWTERGIARNVTVTR